MQQADARSPRGWRRQCRSGMARCGSGCATGRADAIFLPWREMRRIPRVVRERTGYVDGLVLFRCAGRSDGCPCVGGRAQVRAAPHREGEAFHLYHSVVWSAYPPSRSDMPLSAQRVFKTKWFNKAAQAAGISDAEPHKVARQLMQGLGDDLGGNVWKKRLDQNRKRGIVLTRPAAAGFLSFSSRRAIGTISTRRSWRHSGSSPPTSAGVRAPTSTGWSN